MRIAIFTNTYYPTLNGVANCVAAYRRGLERHGHEVYIFAPCPGEHDPVVDEPRILRFPAVPLPGEWDYDIAVPYSRPVMGALRDVTFDLVHTQHPVWVGVWGAMFARWAGLPLVTTIHTEYELYTRLVPLPEQLVDAYLKARVSTYCNRCHVVTTPVASARERLIKQGVLSPVELVPNPVELSRMPTPDRAGTRAALGIPADAFTMGFIGRLAPEKNLDLVLDAAAIVMRQIPEARFLMVGDGPEMKGLRTHAAKAGLADRVTFTGAVAHARVAHYHATLDAFMTASMSETQPLAYTEAMAVGTPIVAVRAPGAQDMVDHGCNGLLSDPAHGAAGLAAEALKLAADPELRDRIVRAAREGVGRYDLEQVLDRLLEVYDLARRRHASQEQ